MAKPRKLKLHDQKLDDQLNLDELVATKGDTYNIYAMNPDTEVPSCIKCNGRVENHGRYERQYLDVTVNENGSIQFITLHYLFYKYRCLASECSSVFQKPITFAKENAHVTERFEDIIMKYASYLSYSKVEDKVRKKVTKQAVGQITKRWTMYKDEKRGSFYTPKILGLISFFGDKKDYIIAVDAGDEDLHIIDVLPSVSSEEIIILLSHMDRSIISYVLTDCDPIIVDTAKDQLPNAEVLVNTDALFQQALNAFNEIIKKDAKHVMNDDKKLLKKNPIKLAEWEIQLIRNVTNRKPRVSIAYDHVNSLRFILSKDWDVSDIRDWNFKIPIDCQNEFEMTAEYINTYLQELLKYYLRRTEVTDGLYDKLMLLDNKLSKFKLCSDEIFRARVLYTCSTIEEIEDEEKNDSVWRGVPYDTVIKTIELLLKEKKENEKNEY